MVIRDFIKVPKNVGHHPTKEFKDYEVKHLLKKNG